MILMINGGVIISILMGHFLTFIVLLHLSISNAIACTGFVINSNGGPIIARNTDLSFGPAVLVKNKAGIQKVAYVPTAKQTPLRWISKYRSLTINHVGTDFPNEGINEKGLMIAPFSLHPDRKYPVLTDKVFTNELQWMQFQLDIHTSVDDVVQSLKELNFARIIISNTIQFLVCDQHRCVVIESNPEGYRIHDIARLPAIANDPYDESYSTFVNTPDLLNGSKFISGKRFLVAAGATSFPDTDIGKVRKFARTKLAEVAQVSTQFQILYEPRSATLRIQRPNEPIELVASVYKLASSYLLPLSLASAQPIDADGVFYCNAFLRTVTLDPGQIELIKAHIETAVRTYQ